MPLGSFGFFFLANGFCQQTAAQALSTDFNPSGASPNCYMDFLDIGFKFTGGNTGNLFAHAAFFFRFTASAYLPTGLSFFSTNLTFTRHNFFCLSQFIDTIYWSISGRVSLGSLFRPIHKPFWLMWLFSIGLYHFFFFLQELIGRLKNFLCYHRI